MIISCALVPCSPCAVASALLLAGCSSHHLEGRRHETHDQGDALSRGAVVRRASSALVAGAATLGALGAPALALDPLRDPLKAQPPPPALLLPVIQLKVATTRFVDLLGDPSRWEEARSLLSSPPLSQQDFRKALDRYSDSNWEKHILGDLYRNQGLASMKALDDIMAFALQQQANGVPVTQDDIDDVREAGRALAASLSDFVALAPPEDVRMVERLVLDEVSP